MIRFDRGREPEELARRRAAALPDAIAMAQLHGVGSREHFAKLENYDQGKSALHRAQGGKCAYCERFTPVDGNPLEHFRPKKGAIRADRSVDRAHYWWLCWTWENHVFACNTCNGQSRKGNRFHVERAMATPNVSQAVPIPAEFFDWTAENAALIDPATEDPLDHLEWRPNASTRRLSPKLWQWDICGLTARGEATIAILQLDANIDVVAATIRNHVLPRVEAIRARGDAGALADAREQWERLLSDTVENPSSELRGPTWSALQHLLAEVERQRFGLRAAMRP
ncbi:MAG: hypothetical protein H6747_10790 [Deltaproteobacteria bacterium]|nr:hypothetical protein [Deltaproteobacteria bacterium]